MLRLANDEQMKRLESLANEFYEKVLRPEEDPGFVSDDASLLDISLATEEELIEKIKIHYGKIVKPSDLRRSFWSLLTVIST